MSSDEMMTPLDDLPVTLKQSAVGKLNANEPKQQQSNWLQWLLPLDNGPAEIRALDGLRAIAALMIVTYHVMLFEKLGTQSWSLAINNDWYFLTTGVQLFFTLSGFLLFRPYASAMLQGKPLPSTLGFYQKRALRILPAYWLLLLTLFIYKGRFAQSPVWLNFVFHVMFLHDIIPAFNRDLNGPFWTLAVEAQFYMLLPWMAAAIPWVMGYHHRDKLPQRLTVSRLIVGLIGLISIALLIHWFAIQLMSGLPANADGGVAYWLSLILNGVNGKYLETFLVGAIAAVLYTAVGNRVQIFSAPKWMFGAGFIIFGAVVMVPLVLDWGAGDLLLIPGAHWGWDNFFYQLGSGIAYSAILLGVVWSGNVVRAPFEFAPLRFIGHISYSLYIWHLPILHGTLPLTSHFSTAERIILMFIVSYVSYQFVERPFLQRRRSITAAFTGQNVARA